MTKKEALVPLATKVKRKTKEGLQKLANKSKMSRNNYVGKVLDEAVRTKKIIK